MTQHDQYVAALKRVRGAQFVQLTGRYTMLTRDKKDALGRPTYWFVGWNGAVRYGRNASGSLAMGGVAKADLLRTAALIECDPERDAMGLTMGRNE